MPDAAFSTPLTHVLGQALPAGGVAAGEGDRLLEDARACAAGPGVREGAARTLPTDVCVVLDHLLTQVTRGSSF